MMYPYTGHKPIRAAIDNIVDHGRPRASVSLKEDRGHKELPICPDYVGKISQPVVSEEIIVEMT